ncbi:lipoprotein insertase outer membrane protein LolB [Paraglaciecola aquimarina]|uniref:Outer-membrane lipoprotein LolB n=1 Tax=Paraglaciecola algarum TaxID=3050085 RepID=A0ABS9DBK6_9ALTE|nr:lipoprotein insertase outer membrane protein LolB [Paraglaciecola sp. G1-23]MCF2949740.1 lipoprotein insertase outer membrane protein LolB [Paraglaciecola sp. G1-23]
MNNSRSKLYLTRLYVPRLSVFCLTLVLFACAQTPIPQAQLNSVQHQKSLSEFKNWQIKGRLGFKSPNKKQSANFSWQQKQSEYKLNLTSVIGTSILKMYGDKNQVTLEADDEVHQDSNASFLIWRMTGWQIPVEQFPIWIKGQITQNADFINAEQGWVTQIQPNCDQCEDWLINYDNYKLVGDTWLPHTITFLNRSNNNQLLIRVNSWS